MVDAHPEATFRFVPGTRDTTHDEPLMEKPRIRPYVHNKRKVMQAALDAAAGKVVDSKVWDPRPLPAGEPEVWADVSRALFLQSFLFGEVRMTDGTHRSANTSAKHCPTITRTRAHSVGGMASPSAPCSTP